MCIRDSSGGVRYAAPSKKDPTTDIITLKTEALVYDGQGEKFRGDTTFVVSMVQPSGAPIKMAGSAFVVPSSLEKFTVTAGIVSQSSAPLVANEYSKRRTELNRAVEEAAEKSEEAAQQGLQHRAALSDAAEDPPFLPAPTPATQEAAPVPQLK